MPNARTHDAITFLLAIPAFAVTYAATQSVSASAAVTVAFIFGGLMFGPDLDTFSRQYSRWLLLRHLWRPYKSFFKHRSRFSHGLLFGALIRVIYFLGVISLLIFLVLYIYATYTGGRLPGIDHIVDLWTLIGRFTRNTLGENFLVTIFVGLWLGAASHTFTDIAGSYIKTGRNGKYL